MPELTISTVDLGLDESSAKVTVSTCDASGGRVNAHTATHVIVKPIDVETATDGTVTITLPASADLFDESGGTPVYFRATVGNYTRTFEKSSGTEDLLDTFEPTPTPEPPGSFATTDLSDWSHDPPGTGDVPIWDGTQWDPGPQGGDAATVTIVAGEGIAVDDTDPTNPVVSNAGILEVRGDGRAQINDWDDPQRPIIILDASGLAISGEAEYFVSVEAADREAADDVLATSIADLSGVTDPATARTNLGLGTAATQPATAFDPAGSAAAAVTTAGTAAIPKALVDAKGDLVVGTADNVPARIGVGTAGQVLTVDAATATGVAWRSPAAVDTGAFFFTTR